MVHLTEQTPAEETSSVWDADSRNVNLFSAANETVSFQLVLDAPAGGLEGVKLSVSPLIGSGGREISVENIKLFRMLPVAIERYPAWYLLLTDAPVKPARFYDALKPIKSSDSFDVAAGERLAVWVDVTVQRNRLPGDYVGAITVLSSQGSTRAKVSLKVYDFVLPDAKPVACMGGFGYETIFSTFGGAVPVRLDAGREDVRAGLTVIRQLMRLAHEHRVDLFDKSIHPAIKRDMSGAVALQWDDYDNIVKPYLDGSAFDDRVGVSAWPAPFRIGWPKPASYGGVGTDAYRKTAEAVLAGTAKHFKSIGFGDRMFVWPGTASAGQRAYERYSSFARMVRLACPETPILTELSPAPPKRTGWNPPKKFTSLADMYAPPANMVNPSAAKRLNRNHRLDGLWLRPGRPPYLGGCGVLSSPSDVRALPWIAMKYDCPGVFIPEVLNWSKPGDEADRLFYPEKSPDGNTVLSSVRLKRLRRGLQDSAYLWLLRQRQKPAVARRMIDTMVHYACLDAAGDHHLDARLDGWVADGEVWASARRLLAEEVLSAVHPEKVSKRQLLSAQLAWKQLRQLTCRVRVERIRSRIKMLDDGRFAAVVRAELYNEQTNPVDVKLRIADLPAGWKPTAARIQKQLKGSELSVLTLSAEGAGIPTGPDAKINIPLVLTAASGDAENILASVPFIRAGLTTGAITIDGNLDDWPMRRGNTAGAFIVLGRRGRVGKGLARRQTSAFVMRDDKNLYVAFRCDEPKMDKVHARADNIVRYEQFLAFGEDMVELIIDPGRKARSAADLYHLVVKCNGVVLVERGIGADLARVKPWPVRVRSAVAKSEKLWIVELAIPLKAFGSDGAEPLWGINFTRFATAGSEASSWAGAVRYFYSPENLGTLFLPSENEK